MRTLFYFIKRLGGPKSSDLFLTVTTSIVQNIIFAVDTFAMSIQHPHLGRNIKRLREILGIKQEALAIELGSDWSQKKISLLEGKDLIERPLLEQIAKAMKMPVEAIEHFDEESTVLNIQNNYDNSNANATGVNANGQYHECTFNPFDKMIELIAENKALYERLLDSEKEKVKLLERMLGK